jgi:hypothetical protein
MDEHGTYLSIQNGHLNMMRQTMGGFNNSPSKKQSMQLVNQGSMSNRGRNKEQ